VVAKRTEVGESIPQTENKIAEAWSGRASLSGKYIAGANERENETELTMSTPDQTLLQLIDLAASHFRVPASELNPDDDFFKKLKINSLQALDLLTKLESHFNIELPDYELQGVTDFRTLADRIQARL